MLQLVLSLISADLNDAVFQRPSQTRSRYFPCALYHMCTAPGLWDSFALLSLIQPLPWLCPSACSGVTFLTPTSSNHTPLSAGQEGFSPKAFLPRASNHPPVLSFILGSDCCWVSSPDLARSDTEGALFSLPFYGLYLKESLGIKSFTFCFWLLTKSGVELMSCLSQEVWRSVAGRQKEGLRKHE